MNKDNSINQTYIGEIICPYCGYKHNFSFEQSVN